MGRLLEEQFVETHKAKHTSCTMTAISSLNTVVADIIRFKGADMRYRFICMHDTYSDSKLDYERWYTESEVHYKTLTKRLRERIPCIDGVIVSVSMDYNEVMIDTCEKLTDSDIEYLCRPSTLGGHHVVCT